MQIADSELGIKKYLDLTENMTNTSFDIFVSNFYRYFELTLEAWLRL